MLPSFALSALEVCVTALGAAHAPLISCLFAVKVCVAAIECTHAPLDSAFAFFALCTQCTQARLEVCVTAH